MLFDEDSSIIESTAFLCQSTYRRFESSYSDSSILDTSTDDDGVGDLKACRREKVSARRLFCRVDNSLNERLDRKKQPRKVPSKRTTNHRHD